MEYEYHYNSQRFTDARRDAAAACVRNLSNWEHAVNEIHDWPEYEQQPLRDLPGHAQKIGISKLYFKDESLRFGADLGSFKALGAPYAVFRILAREVFSKTGTYPTSSELRSGHYREITQRVTVCVATDGNQGRGLAYGAKIFGCRCVDYIHNHVSPGRADMMEGLGAIVIRINGEYEASVERAKEDARMNGWHFVSSTSWDDFESEIPSDVMSAYMVVVSEAVETLPAVDEISHVFVCGGVGSIAAAIFLGFWDRWKQNPSSQVMLPRFIIVEPSEADCLLQSAKAGQSRLSQGSLQTVMAGLACRGPSPAALKVLLWLASDFIAVHDAVVVKGMRSLASGAEKDVPVVCGESSAASMGIMLQACKDGALWERLKLTTESKVVLFGLEGATDPKIYQELVGLKPQEVFTAQANFMKNLERS